MSRILSLCIAAVCMSAVSVAASPMDDRIAQAQQCGMQNDYVCSFDILIDLAENDDMPIADNSNGMEFISGAMLESSLIRAADRWSDAETRLAADRYLAVVSEAHPDLGIFYATGHTLRAMSCGEIGDVDCRQESLNYLCANQSRLIAPRSGHPGFQDFTNRLLRLMQECQGSS